jgi:peptidoglycan/xylan/chitin deacetylase (PgdA/CDA1 family)
VRSAVFFFAALTIFGPLSASAERVAITFDDLPLNGQLPVKVNELDIARETLAILKKRRITAVYGFINAKKLEGNPKGAEALKLWVKAGHRVGNHTYGHINLHTNTPEAFAREVEQNEPALQLLAKDDAWRWLRYPYLREGDTVEKRRAVRVYLNDHRYRIAQVTLDYEDYLWNTPYARCVMKNDAAAISWLRASYLQTAADYLDANREMARLVFGRKVDHVLLLHLGAFSGEILPALFDLLKQKGFDIASLESVHRDPIYATDPDSGSRYGGTLLEQWMDVKQMPYPKVPKKPQKELDALCR